VHKEMYWIGTNLGTVEVLMDTIQVTCLYSSAHDYNKTSKTKYTVQEVLTCVYYITNYKLHRTVRFQ